MTSVMLRHPYIRYRRGRIDHVYVSVLVYCRDRFTLGNKKTFKGPVHPAYACEATTAKEPARSQSGTGSMEEQAGPTPSIANVWVT